MDAEAKSAEIYRRLAETAGVWKDGRAYYLDRLQLVLQALLENAFRFGAPGREVLVRGELAGEPPHLLVRVTNEGPPIPEALRAGIVAMVQASSPGAPENPVNPANPRRGVSDPAPNRVDGSALLSYNATAGC